MGALGLVPARIIQPGGSLPVYDINAAAVIKANPGVLYRIIVNTAPSAGDLIVNDCLTTGAAAITNQIISLAFGSLTLGTIIELQWPCNTGIVISSVGTGGVFSAAYI